MADGIGRTAVSQAAERSDLRGDVVRRRPAEDQRADDRQWDETEWGTREWDDREWMETILDSISEAVVFLDGRLAITHLNAAAAALTGYTAEQAGRLPLETVLPLRSESDRPPLRDLCRQVELTNQPVSVTLTDAVAAPGRAEVPVDYRIASVRAAAADLPAS